MIQLEYTLQYQRENTLSVEIEMNGNVNRDTVLLVCAGIRLYDLKCFDGDKIHFPETENGVLYAGGNIQKIQYIAILGAGGKHGYQGVLQNEYGAFELARAAALPYPQKHRSGEPLCFACGFTVCLPDRRERFTALLDSVYRAAKLRKNSVFFTAKPPMEGNIRLFMQLPDDAVAARTMKIVSFFETLFGFRLPEFKLFLLNGGSDPVFGGAGDDSAAFSLDGGNERDFELLAHRLFHAFFSKTAYAEEYFLPPYSFMEEGFASLYELAATKTDVKKSVFSLYKRYLFYYFAKPGFTISPADESRLSDKPWLVEFLHYTMSPLVMYASGRAFEPCPAEELYRRLQDDGLLGDGPLFLPEFDNGYHENEAGSVAELNDFEYVISSWRGTHEKTVPLPDVAPPESALEHRLYAISKPLYRMIKSAGGVL